MEFALENSNLDSIKYDKLKTLKRTLDQSLVNFRDLVADYDRLSIEAEKYKTQFLAYKEKCDRNCCSGSEALKKVIAIKDDIIQSIASELTKFNETKDFNSITQIFNIICSESSPSLTPPVEDRLSPINNLKNSNDSIKSGPKESVKLHFKKSPETGLNVTIDDVSFNDDSLSEIEGTPSGRTSPILHAKAGKNKSVSKINLDLGDKKKCSSSWPTPESKVIKLSFPTPSKCGKLRQSRLVTTLVKRTNVVDLTSSPEPDKCKTRDEHAKMGVKREPTDNDETILPSPTSGPANLKSPFKRTKKKKSPKLSLKPKVESECQSISQEPNKTLEDITRMEESINNINKEFRFQSPVKPVLKKEQVDLDATNFESPIIPFVRTKSEKKAKENYVREEKKENLQIKEEPMEEDLAHLDTNSSMSLLQRNVKRSDKTNSSPTKRPLAENINTTNVKADSMSLLKPCGSTILEDDSVKRKVVAKIEPAYIEPAVRKKAEKQALPGWACDECKNFFGELYKDDPVMLQRKIQECSKHRGHHNPQNKGKFPAGFWDVRWSVPSDTEEFNKRNNAV